MSDLPVDVAVELRPCDGKGWTATDVMRFLEVDLGPRGITLIAGTSAKAAAELGAVATGCQADTPRVVLTVRDRLTHKVVSRGLNLADVAQADQARWVALSGAELLRASWAEAANQEYATVVARVSRMGDDITLHVKPEAPPPKDGPTRTVGATTFALEARGLFAPAYRASLAGGAFVVERRLAGLDLSAGAEALWGRTVDAAGEISVQLRSVEASARLPAQLGAQMSLGVGPSVRVGSIGFDAEALAPNVAQSATGVFASAGLSTSATAAISSHWSAALHLELSYALAGARARAQDRPTAGISGTFAVVGMGIQWTP